MSLSPAASSKSNAVKLHCLPQNVKAAIATALYEGGRKYGTHNWRENEIIASDYYNSTVGHFDSWWEGEDIDKDSKLHHICKMLASGVVLLDAILNDKLIDDRPIKNKNSNWKQDFKAHTKELINLYPNCCEPFTEERKTATCVDYSPPERFVDYTNPVDRVPYPDKLDHLVSKIVYTPQVTRQYDLSEWVAHQDKSSGQPVDSD